MLPRLLRSLAIALGLTPALGAVPAAAQDEGAWEINVGHMVCTVRFTEQWIADGIGRIEPYGRCDSGLRNLNGFAMNDSTGDIVLYNVTGGNPTLLGSIYEQGEGVYAGSYGDGESMTMVYNADATGAGSAPSAPQPRQQANTGRPQPSPNCLVMYDSGQCAPAEDVGAPDIPFGIGNTASFSPVTRLNIRFMPNTNSRKLGVLEPMQCVEVERCQNGFDGQVWCQFKHNNFTAWALKQDRQFVYARNSCG